MKSLALASSISLVLLGCAASSTPPPSQPQQASSEKVAVVDLNAPKEAPTAAPNAAPSAAPSAENPDSSVAKAEAMKEAERLGMLKPIDPKDVSSSSGRDDELGQGHQDNMWGGAVGESFGVGGLGLTGLGTGGGGQGNGIGLGSIGTLGHGAGPGTGTGYGRGLGGIGRPGGKVPKMVMGATSVSGRLPPEVVQRIVRQNFGRFRLCYEKGLLKDPNLGGSVNVKFVIGKDGSVTNAASNGSDIPDVAMVTCVTQAFRALKFPEPEGGVVAVVYPLKFSPGADAPAPATPASSAPAAPSAAPAPPAKP